MVKKNSNFKFKGAAKNTDKKPRKKSSFVPYDDSLFTRDDGAEDLVRTFLRDTRGSRNNSYDYYNEDSSSLW